MYRRAFRKVPASGLVDSVIFFRTWHGLVPITIFPYESAGAPTFSMRNLMQSFCLMLNFVAACLYSAEMVASSVGASAAAAGSSLPPPPPLLLPPFLSSPSSALPPASPPLLPPLTPADGVVGVSGISTASSVSGASLPPLPAPLVE